MLSNRVYIDDIQDHISGKRVLLRADFNVPMDKGVIKDDKRIAETMGTIHKILDHKPKCLVIMSHLGRPDGKRVEKYSLKPVAERLEKLLGDPVTFTNECVGEEVEKVVNAATNGQVILLENLRFHLEEEGKTTDETGKSIKASKEQVELFRKQLTALGDIYINDAFGTAHRAHSSMVGVKLPIRAAGMLMKKELDFFATALEKPERPLLVILGGAKVKDKIQLIKNLIEKVDEMIIGGGMAFTFLKDLYGWEIGNSLFDESAGDLVHEVSDRAHIRNVKLHFPVDFVCGDKMTEDAEVITTEGNIPKGYMGLDIGPKTVEMYNDIIKRAKTIVWNGPQGLFEVSKFAHGSESLVVELADATKAGAITIVGGGDSVSMVNKMGEDKVHLSHLSTGGGASLELLEGRMMPGIECLSKVEELAALPK